MRLFTLSIIALLISLVIPSNTYAITNPLNQPNNIYGIHVIDENDLEDAAKLVNSNGGDWGYVTIVIREDERDVVRWTRAFERMKSLHLIPIVRVATLQTDRGWSKGNVNKINEWIEFFERLPWFTENRYIVVGNEPNHATEWGGEISPEEYLDYLISFSDSLKEASRDYFILPAGLDASAPNGRNYMTEETFIRRMYSHNNKFFDYIDGWTSHSYPNPAFMGSVYDTGQKSIHAFEWELSLLNSLGLQKDLPIFITETGWAHDYDNSGKYLDSQKIAENYKVAYEKVWSHPHVVTATPFILAYSGKPFSQFSWKDSSGEYFDFYYDIQTYPKVKGDPLMKDRMQELIITDYAYNLYHFFWIS